MRFPDPPFQFANSFALGPDGFLKLPGCSRAPDSRSKRSQECQHRAEHGRAENNQHERRIVLPEKKTHGYRKGVLERKEGDQNREHKRNEERGHHRILLSRLFRRIRNHVPTEDRTAANCCLHANTATMSLDCANL